MKKEIFWFKNEFGVDRFVSLYLEETIHFVANYEIFFFPYFVSFTGKRVLVTTFADDTLRGIIRNTFTDKFNRQVYYITYCGRQTSEWNYVDKKYRNLIHRFTRSLYDFYESMTSVKDIQDDTIIDPFEWNPEGKPIEFHDEFEVDAAYDGFHYHVFRCKYCGIYSRDIDQHKNKRHYAEMHGATPLRRGTLMRPPVRPRRLTDDDLNAFEE